MEAISVCNRNPVSLSQLSAFSTFNYTNAHRFPLKLSPSTSSRLRCSYNGGKIADTNDDEPLTLSRAYGVLGLTPQCSSAQIKAAFRAKVKQFHPDVMGGTQDSDAMIRRVIQAYEILSNYSKSEIIERECMDPFDQPECEAYDVFINEVLCMGKGCPYSCVSTAPHAFRFSSETGTAHATSQGHAGDYQVQRAVGQCPRTCMHYVTPSQRIILEELLDSILNMPYDTSAEAEFLYSLIVKARYENNRYQSPKKNPKVSSKHVDWL
ncbi:hypothetical protein AAHA92_28730 [Salvia divinorum]|uniref:J domain-containing protein n=1 Tax=Salvia divinorum TaxID=28513 RepID=A0ABD1FYJ0_SALDI